MKGGCYGTIYHCTGPDGGGLYEQVAVWTGRSVEQVLADALFKLAGERCLGGLRRKDTPGGCVPPRNLVYYMV